MKKSARWGEVGAVTFAPYRAVSMDNGTIIGNEETIRSRSYRTGAVQRAHG